MARIIVIADGVSTCKNSKRGAELACKPHFSDNSGTCTTTTKNVETAIDINIIPAKNFSQFVLATDGAWKTFYKNGVLSAALKNAVANGNIASYLEEQKCDDDCSIAVMNLKKGA